MAPDILDVVVAKLGKWLAGLGVVAGKNAEKTKEKTPDRCHAGDTAHLYLCHGAYFVEQLHEEPEPNQKQGRDEPDAREPSQEDSLDGRDRIAGVDQLQVGPKPVNCPEIGET
jgi:hypothetical protein